MMLSSTDRLESDIRQAADMIRSSNKTVILTGAGVSTPSGIPDFRSLDDGLWTRYNPFEVSSLTAFRRNPESFYDWIRPLALQIVNAHPNEAHIGMADLEKRGYIRTIVTQNIDGLHQMAGAKDVLEVHGSWSYLSCTNCYQRYASTHYMKPYLMEGKIPHCPKCACVLKPDLILIGEQLPARVWMKAAAASSTCELMIVAGSSLEVIPAAGLPARAVDSGAKLIIINHTETYMDARANLVFHEDVSLIIPSIANKVMGN